MKITLFILVNVEIIFCELETILILIYISVNIGK